MPIVYGNAIKFVSASSQYAARTRVSNASDNVTVAFWLYMDSLPASNKQIITNGDSPNHFGYDIRIGSDAKLNLDMIFVDGTCKTATALSAGQWYHVVFQRASGVSQFYINGVADGVTSSATWNAISALSTTGLGAFFTASSVPVAGTYADCRLDDVRFYDRAISGAEITALYNYGLNINNPDISNTSLVAWWKMDESSGNPADSSGNANTLTNGNSATFVQGIVQLSNSGYNIMNTVGM